MAMKGRHRPASTAGYLTDAVRRDDVLELRGPVAGYFVWSGLPTAPTPNRHDRCSWWPEELAVDAEVRALGSPAVPAVHGFERESNHCPGFTAFRDTGKPLTCDMATWVSRSTVQLRSVGHRAAPSGAGAVVEVGGEGGVTASSHFPAQRRVGR
jgi:hypothetical protein